MLVPHVVVGPHGAPPPTPQGSVAAPCAPVAPALLPELLDRHRPPRVGHEDLSPARGHRCRHARVWRARLDATRLVSAVAETATCGRRHILAILSRTKHRHLNVALNRSWNTPIGQNEYVWRVGTRGRIRIRFLVRVRKNVSRCIAASGKKSGIGAVLSEQSSFAEVSLNRRRALRILSRI